MRTIFFVLCVTVISFGQPKGTYSVVDTIMDKIPSKLGTTTIGIAEYINTNFISEDDKVRAIFYWITSNIRYDIKNLKNIDYSEIPQDKIQNTLITKKGVCIHYAEVFNDLTHKVGIKSYLIYGYTKQNRKIDILSHAWCAARIDNAWWFFDPTWGAGYVEKGKFYKKMNNIHYKVAPSQFILTHIPFDYLWEFLNYPITNQEFMEGKTQMNKTKPYFDYITQMEHYDSLSDLDKAKDALVRVQKNGIKNNLIREMILYKKSEIGAIQNNEAMEKFRLITDDYNQVVVLFNDFVAYRNKRFKPTLPDETIREMIQTPKEKILDCQKRIQAIGSYNDDNIANVKIFKSSLIILLQQIEEQEQFVKDYLNKSKLARKKMFSNITMFGIPLR